MSSTLEQFKKLLNELPHADRVCELYGVCDCGRDEISAKLLELFNAENPPPLGVNVTENINTSEKIG